MIEKYFSYIYVYIQGGQWFLRNFFQFTEFLPLFLTCIQTEFVLSLVVKVKNCVK